jgi:hypothetical protein
MNGLLESIEAMKEDFTLKLSALENQTVSSIDAKLATQAERLQKFEVEMVELSQASVRLVSEIEQLTKST